MKKLSQSCGDVGVAIFLIGFIGLCISYIWTVGTFILLYLTPFQLFVLICFILFCLGFLLMKVSEK